MRTTRPGARVSSARTSSETEILTPVGWTLDRADIDRDAARRRRLGSGTVIDGVGSVVTRPSYRDRRRGRIQERVSTDRRAIPPVALVHDYFVQDGGAEAVAIELAALFPDAPIHTTFFEGDRFADRIDPRRIRAWGLAGRVPASPWFRPLLPAYIAHFSRLEVPASRLVISNSSTFARGVARPTAGDPHRLRPFADALRLGRRRLPRPFELPAAGQGGAPRRRARSAAAGIDGRGAAPTCVVANSENVRRRIRATWGRDSRVIHPPVEVAGVAVSARP